MAFHGRPALPDENPPTIHGLLIDRLRVSLPSSAAHTCGAGVLLGVCGELGVSMPWGYRRPAGLRVATVLLAATSLLTY
jgi:hypothetical protein